MEKVFEIASNVSSPLALAGIISTILFFVLRQIIKGNIFPQLSRQLSSEIIKLIINRLFVLSLIAMILGFIGYIMTNSKQSDDNILQEDLKGNISGICFIDNSNSLVGADIIIPEISKSGITNSFGKFDFEYLKNSQIKNFTINIRHDYIKDTTISLDEIGVSKSLKFYLKRKKVKSRSKSSKSDDQCKLLLIPLISQIEKSDLAYKIYKGLNGYTYDNAKKLYKLNEVTKKILINHSKLIPQNMKKDSDKFLAHLTTWNTAFLKKENSTPNKLGEFRVYYDGIKFPQDVIDKFKLIHDTNCK